MTQSVNNKMLFQPNILIDANYSLDRIQSNIVLMALSKLNTTITYTEQDAIKFDIGELYETSKVKIRKDKYISDVKDAIRALFKKQFSIANPYTGEFKIYNWLSLLEGNLNNNEVKLYFNPYLLDLFNKRVKEGNFTKIFLENVLPLKSQYAKRIYQLVLQYRPPMEIPVIDLDQFRNILNIDSKYSTYKSLNQWAIKPALADINSNTDITLTLTPIREGKTIKRLKFSYKFKTNTKDKYNKPESKKQSGFTKKPTIQEINNLNKAQQQTAELLKSGGIIYK